MEKQISKTTVQKLLIYVGIAPKTSGYGYLTTAIMTELEYRPKDIAMCKLYALVGENHGTTASAVERSMRFAIIRAYNLTGLVGLNLLYKLNIIDTAPMLSEFISYMVHYLEVYYESDVITF